MGESLTIGVDIGGTKIAAGLVDEGGRVLEQMREATPNRDPAAVEHVVAELIGKLRADHDVSAVGIGCAGLVDETRSRVLFAPNLGWKDQPLARAIQALVDLPVVVENDANAAAWAEYRFGGGRDEPELVMVTVGTGIGGGVVIRGELYRGRFGAAAEFGHVQLEVDGRFCACGNRGCWEQYASGTALVREGRTLAAERRGEADILLSFGDGTPEGVQGTHITWAAKMGDEVALSCFDYLGLWLGRGIANIASVLDPGRVVIGGGVCEAGDLLLAPTRRSFLEHLPGRDYRPQATLTLAELGNDAGIIGAADLARHP